MYTPAATVEQHLREHRERPMILCEYAHCMGNSFGAVDRYIDLAYREPLFQGAFIWDFADQAILARDRYDSPFFAYGGDCGEAPHDGDFSGNGILFADHTPKPALAEVKALYAKIVVEVGDATADGIEVQVTNRNLFTSTAAWDCCWDIHQLGVSINSGMIPTDIAPGETATVTIPATLPTEDGEYVVTVSFHTRVDSAWAEAGHEVARGQRAITVGRGNSLPADRVLRTAAGSFAHLRPGVRPLRVVNSTHNIGVIGEHFRVLFSRLSGGIVAYQFGRGIDGGRNMLRRVPQPTFWHAPTSNERGAKIMAEDGAWLLASRYATVVDDQEFPRVEHVGDAVAVTFKHLLPVGEDTHCLVTYRVNPDSRIDVEMTLHVGGDDVADLPEFSMEWVGSADLEHLTWYGHGPHETMSDRRAGADLDVHHSSVSDQYTPYIRPQECGNHTGVRWAAVCDDAGWGLKFSGEDLEFSALHWSAFELENATHHTELPPAHFTHMRVSLTRRGAGGDDSWGARTHPEFCLPARDGLTLRFSVECIRQLS